MSISIKIMYNSNNNKLIFNKKIISQLIIPELYDLKKF